MSSTPHPPAPPEERERTGGGGGGGRAERDGDGKQKKPKGEQLIQRGGVGGRNLPRFYFQGEKQVYFGPNLTS